MNLVNSTTPAMLLIFLLMISPHLSAQQKADDSNYKLIWQDEFNVDGKPDEQKWDYEHGFVRNNEPQWYQPENAFCKDGFLIIETRKEKKKNPYYDSQHKDYRLNREFAEYTSACLITLGKFDFTYGKVTMRAKIDVKQGLWPAFWMLGTNRSEVNWPACGEVDIMEYYRDYLLANAAWEGEQGTDWDESKFPLATLGGKEWAADFHVWEMVWDENQIVISVDGNLVNEISLTKTVNKKQGDNPFKKPFYLLLNVALGQGGELIPDENIPSKMLVDYVRVYQK
ncbi:glycoside hydrolase family 16 protein [Sphingobacterium hungaricum]|uniref:Beta-glucanase n=1 Tax=Sphingobacterium hungaricum TaxID=2082723 RepID=A0A928UVP1_9SPHI|nr:glycoside hydrolase family 16 protein [Sphingobacterium hungaricum]MBE8713572.1 beta-glucanase [Sphingobacterium hungaricum]